MKTYILITVFFIKAISSVGQKLSIDTSSFKEWKELAAPMISPNGKYISYCIRDNFKDSSTIVIKSTITGWNKRCNISKGPIWGTLTNTHFIYTGNLDTLWVVTLEKEAKAYPNAMNFKDNGHLLAISTADRLTVEHNNTIHNYSDVLDFSFTADSNRMLVLSKDTEDLPRKCVIKHVDFVSNSERSLYRADNISKLVYSHDRKKVAFEAFDSSFNTSKIVVCDLVTFKVNAIENNVGKKIRDISGFNRSGDILFIKFVSEEKLEVEQNDADVKIWKYTDERVPLRNMRRSPKDELMYSLIVDGGNLTKLSENFDQWLYLPRCDRWKDKVLISQTAGDCYVQEQLWHPACSRKWFLLDLRTGSRTRITRFDRNNVANKYEYSPDLKHIVYFDEATQSYYSYSVENDHLIELTGSKEREIINEHPGIVKGYLNFGNRGIAAWCVSRNQVFIYDDYDIWRFDLDGRDKPLNVTNNYGRDNNVVLSFIADVGIESDIAPVDDYLLVGLNTITKENNFFKSTSRSPQITKLGGGHCLFYLPFGAVGSLKGMRPIKARSANIYLVQRESYADYPNYFITENFIDFKPVSDYYPEKKYHWFKGELHTWKNRDGRMLQGVLYKPEDFDDSKNYPVVFNIYQHMANSLYAYLKPDYIADGCNVNVPLMLSKGYLVFKPDIFYKGDQAGESALICVESAVNYLSTVRGVDTSRLGIQGCSWGGFETNYIVSHSNFFKAACTAAGASDIMGFSTIRYDPIYTSFYYSQWRIKSMVWEDYRPFVLNSPLFNARDINTPLLLFHTSIDDAVPFNQAVQLFLVLRKLKRKVWLLEYGGSANHGVFDLKQKRDFSIRLSDFFDFYLLDKPMAKWMTSPNSDK